jgi:hypothetical protein
LSAKLDELRDMIDLGARYVQKMHINTLAYHAEIEEELKDAAFESALRRHEKFFASFRSELQNDPPFFERLLHRYFSDGAA